MTESEIYKKLKPILSSFGTSRRIENAVLSGDPDTLFFTSDLLLLLELKVIHSGKIRIQPFQFSFLIEIAHDYPDEKIMFVMYSPEGLGLYPWAQVRPLAMKATDLRSIDVSKLVPQYIADKNGIGQWIGDLNGRHR